MSKIKLKNTSKLIIIDSSDREFLCKYSWRISKAGYVYTQPKKNEYGNGARPTYLIRRLILGFPKLYVDHINRNKLDNRRRNLRTCTPTQSIYNRGRQKNNTSGFIGVSYLRAQNKYSAQISINGKNVRLGLFNCPIKAAKSRDLLARKFHGKFAQLNFSSSEVRHF